LRLRSRKFEGRLRGIVVPISASRIRAPLLAAGLLLAGVADAPGQILIARPEALDGIGVPVSPGILSRGVSPADTVPTFAPFLSSVSLLPRYLHDVIQERPASPENLAFEAYLERERQRRNAEEWQDSRLARLRGEPEVARDADRGAGGPLRVPERIASNLGGWSTVDVK
jgi:hypothetical protein